MGEVAADGAVVVLATADADADRDATAGELVHRGDLLGHLHGVVGREDHDRRPEADPLGERGRGRELHGQRVARVGDPLGHGEARPRALVDPAAPGEDLLAALRKHGRHRHRDLHRGSWSSVYVAGSGPSNWAPAAATRTQHRVVALAHHRLIALRGADPELRADAVEDDLCGPVRMDAPGGRHLAQHLGHGVVVGRLGLGGRFVGAVAGRVGDARVDRAGHEARHAEMRDPWPERSCARHSGKSRSAANLLTT